MVGVEYRMRMSEWHGYSVITIFGIRFDIIMR